MQNGANCAHEKKIESRHKFVTLIQAIRCAALLHVYIPESFANEWKRKFAINFPTEMQRKERETVNKGSNYKGDDDSSQR